MKYERYPDRHTLPCGTTLDATRDTNEATWLITESFEEARMCHYAISVRSIPGIIKFLRLLYKNSPKSYK